MVRLVTAGPGSLAGHVRQHDPARYVSSLYAAPVQRPHLWALYALNLELNRSEAASEAAMAVIRLQWWRDAVADACAGGQGVDRHPLLPVLADLPPAVAAMIDAAIAARQDALEHALDIRAAAQGTSGRLMQMAGVICAAVSPPDALCNAGAAWGLVHRDAAAGLALWHEARPHVRRHDYGVWGHAALIPAVARDPSVLVRPIALRWQIWRGAQSSF